MATRDDLNAAIKESNEAVNALAVTVANEANEVKSAVAVLEAKILQGQTDPSIPIDYSAEIDLIKASVSTLQSVTQAVDTIYSAPVAPDVTDSSSTPA